MKVSIVIPVYNVAAHIRRCLESVCQQTYTDLECLLIDDCGSDDSIAIAAKYIENYNGRIRFHIIHQPKNMGPSAARNTGIDSATGDFIFFLDSDDAITPDCIETLVKLIEKYPDVDFSQGNTVQGIEGLSKESFRRQQPEYCHEKDMLCELILEATSNTAWNRLIKRSFLIKNNLYFPVEIIIEDVFWVYFLAKKTNAAAFTNKGTYLYYLNSGSIMTSTSKEMVLNRMIGMRSGISEMWKDMLVNKPVYKSQQRYFAQLVINYLMQLCQHPSLCRWTEFWRMMWCMTNENTSRITWPKVLLFFSSVPPLCFFAGFRAWRWRLQKYIVDKI